MTTSTDLTFITNESGENLCDRFGVLLGDDTRFFDCLVGYFFISGFHKLHPALTKTEKIRILIGIKTDAATYELIQTANKQQEFVFESHAQVRERVPGEILRELQESGDSSDSSCPFSRRGQRTSDFLAGLVFSAADRCWRGVGILQAVEFLLEDRAFVIEPLLHFAKKAC